MRMITILGCFAFIWIKSLADDNIAASLEWNKQTVQQQKNLCNVLNTDTPLRYHSLIDTRLIFYAELPFLKG